MAFKIIPKLKAKIIQDRSLDTSFLGKYYKKLQVDLLQNTKPEIPTEFFFCQDFGAEDHLLVMGTQTAGHKKIFERAGKGNDGFDKAKVSMGTCFIREKDGKSILCLLPTRGKAKKETLRKLLDKMRRSYMKKIDGIEILAGPVIVDAEDGDKVEQVSDDDQNNNVAVDSEPLVKKDEIVKRTKELQKGIAKLKKDVMKRYKKRETSLNDAAFVKALRKAGAMFLSKLTQTDEKTGKAFSKQKKIVEKGLEQWKELEGRILSQKAKKEATVAMKKDLKDAVARMNISRKEIKKILKRVDLKSLG